MQRLDEFDIFFGGVFLAIVAHQSEFAIDILHPELGRDVVFLVGDAVRVEALHDVLDALRWSPSAS